VSDLFGEDPEFEAAKQAEADALVVDLDGFEGPLHLLLALARKKKIDLARISILELAEQYLLFVEEARTKRLDLAAEYLVMASWLAFLKSKLLLPKPRKEDDDMPAEAMAAALAFRLRRLDAMRAAAEALYARPIAGQNVHMRGAPEGVRALRSVTYEADLHDLLSAYAQRRAVRAQAVYSPPTPRVYGLENARERLDDLLPAAKDWETLDSLLPSEDDLGADPPPRKSVRASSMLAALEITKDGHARLRQSAPFAPLYVRGSKENKTADKRSNEEETPS
jgi:segregation and condensation protein A